MNRHTPRRRRARRRMMPSCSVPRSAAHRGPIRICLPGGGLRVAFTCDSALKNWWALHVTGKAPALLLARIKQLEAENGNLNEELDRAYQDLKEVDEFHDTAGFARLATVLGFPGI